MTERLPLLSRDSADFSPARTVNFFVLPDCIRLSIGSVGSEFSIRQSLELRKLFGQFNGPHSTGQKHF